MILKSVRIDCDRCCVFGDEGRSLKEVRCYLKIQGWKTSSEGDFCPTCLEKIREAKASGKVE